MNAFEKMNKAFEQAEKKVVFKGSALENTKQIARDCMKDLEDMYEDRIDILEFSAIDLNRKIDTLIATNKKAQDTIQRLKTKLERVTSSSNKERKNAAARANRYKAKYDKLLDDLDLVMPGAKELILSSALSTQEKEAKLLKIDSQIDHYMKESGQKEYYNADKRRDVYLPGYGKVCRILQALRAKKKRLMEQKSY